MRRFFNAVSVAISAAATALASLAGVAAAKYRQYWDGENAKVQDEARNRRRIEVDNTLRLDYEFIVDLLIEAINNAHEVAHLYPVTQRSQVICSPWRTRTKLGVWVFQFRTRYRRGCGVSAAEVKRILQSELDQLCDYYGYMPLLVNVWFQADGAVVIRIVSAQAWSEAKNVALKEGV